MKQIIITTLQSHNDSRGVLTELFRNDEIPNWFNVSMGYVSITKPGVSRGPHEHTKQSDMFVFTDGAYELRLWDTRPGTDQTPIILKVGKDNPVCVIVPPGVVHGYKNIGEVDAFVLNFPDKLYAGEYKLEPVDEIRHEEFDSPYKMD